jgi:hypothetical protein
MRTELFWDRKWDRTSAEKLIERAINFGGFDFIEEVQEQFGMERFIDTLMHNRSLNKKPVNYWCFRLGLDRSRTQAFQRDSIWEPFR